jgi:acetyl esterase/lipase
MRASVTLTALLALGLLAPAGRAADRRAPPVTGGNYKVEVIKDIAYYEGKDADKVKHKLDLYLPKGKKDFPVFFFVHGGAWVMGDRKDCGPGGRLFARNGIGTVIISYRLSPQVKHPAHIQDVAKAFAWTHKHIKEYGGRPDQIFISGHSAGGHLVALLATDESYLKSEGLTLAAIKGAIPLSGVYRIRPGDNLTKEVFGDAKACKQASPLEHVKGKHPPFLIAYGDDDFRTCDVMSEQLGKALKDCKGEAAVLKVPDRNHLTIVLKAAAGEDDPLTQAVLKFIARHSGLKLTAKKASAEK